MKVTQETEHLFRLTQFELVNCYLLREPDGLTLIDAGLPGGAKSILQAVRQLHAPLRRIALTHAHFDHIGALDSLAALIPNLELLVGHREARLLARDLRLDEGERGKSLMGFWGAQSKATRLLHDGAQIGSLKTIASPGHTPGHMAFLDTRDNTLIAGDAFTTQNGVLVAGVFRATFPFPALFSWNGTLSVRSALRLRQEQPHFLATGHGRPLAAPQSAIDRAIEQALHQFPEAR
jgi:glyoxylase-like metal-dependent hydrolase (beta-lactamase superfamily II)